MTDYERDNITVNRERVYLIFNKSATKTFRKATFDLLIKIVKFQFGNSNIKKTKDFVEFWGTGLQLSRKKTAPIMEPLVRAFNEYFYSPSNKFWIKRDFLKKSSDLHKSLKKLRIKSSYDDENRLNYITYPEAKKLSKNLNFSILSLKEYWKALNDAKKIKDFLMVDSLTGSNFVEFLDTIVKNRSRIIEHPRIEDTKVFGKEIRVKIPEGNPGLIHPKDIDLKTGIPRKVRAPREYGSKDLWRYWEPDTNLVVPTRSYIFLLKQPCWDGKFHLEDSLPNLGLRICKKVRDTPEIKIQLNRKELKILIKKDGDILVHKWKK